MALVDEITSDYLIRRYLLDLDQRDSNDTQVGVPTGQDGQPFPESMYTQQVRTSISHFSSQFDLTINTLTQINGERHSDIDFQTARFTPFMMDKRPVRELVSVEVQVGNFPPAVVPSSWWELQSSALGLVRLMPSIQSWAVNAQGSIVALMTQLRYQPGIWRFSYTAGFDGIEGLTRTYALGTTSRPPLVGMQRVTPSVAPASGKTFTATFTGTSKGHVVNGVWAPGTTTVNTLTWAAGDASTQTGTVDFASVTSAVFASTGGTPTFAVEAVPTYPIDYDILDVIGNWATFGISDIAGDLLGGSGIASWSAGQDGQSSSVNTTWSPENHGFSAKQKQQRLRVKECIDAIYMRYHAPGIAAL